RISVSMRRGAMRIDSHASPRSTSARRHCSRSDSTWRPPSACCRACVATCSSPAARSRFPFASSSDRADSPAPGRLVCALPGPRVSRGVVTDALDRDLFRRIQDKVAVVGIGHLPFAKDIGRPISDTAVEAIQLALADAGLEGEDVDGMSMLEMESTHEVSIARRLGVRQLTWWDKISYGGGASSATLMHAAAAVASGLATVVTCHRARNRGSRTSRPWSQERALVRDDKALHTPWGLIRPVDVIGM